MIVRLLQLTQNIFVLCFIIACIIKMNIKQLHKKLGLHYYDIIELFIYDVTVITAFYNLFSHFSLDVMHHL